MTIEEVKSLILKKIGEHNVEIEGAMNDHERLAVVKGDVQSAMKKMILKDKLVFHKACAATLQDLLSEIK